MAIEQLAESLNKLISKANKSCFFTAEVILVDKDNFTLNAKLEDSELEILGIRLKPSEGASKTFIQFPKVGSRVLLSRLDNTEYLLLACDEVETVLWQNSGSFNMEIKADGELIFNGGSLGGLVKAQELKLQLQKNNDVLAAILAVINGAPIPEAGNGAPSALQVALKAVVTGKILGNFNQLENPKISQ